MIFSSIWQKSKIGDFGLFSKEEGEPFCQVLVLYSDILDSNHDNIRKSAFYRREFPVFK